VVAWDAPGCGSSSDPPDGFRVADYARRLVSFIGALGLDRPHVVGLSFGSTLALELYRIDPGLPGTLVLASAYAGWAGSLPPSEVSGRLEQALRSLELPREELVHEWTDSLAPATAAELAEIVRDVRPTGARTMAQAMAEADLRGVLGRITVPALLLYGGEDVRAPRPVAEALHAAIPGSSFVFLPGIGHQANLAAPEAFNAELRRFLSCQ
jgi:pimeloyl-ACP methyl ester carboxylesterase